MYLYKNSGLMQR